MHDALPAEPVLEPPIASLPRDVALQLAQGRRWYHALDFGDLKVPGEFDIAPVLDGYGFPESLAGKRVLDVGRSSGFFAFEFERRGAEVWATEVPSQLDKDFVGGDITRSLVRERILAEYAAAGDDPSEAFIRDDFFLARLLMRSKVTPVDVHIADLSAERLGRFDLVFVGSLLNHVRDIGGALERVFDITGDLCVIANPVSEDTSDRPRLDLLGLRSRRLTTWFLPNLAALVELTEAAGFSEVTVHDPRLMLPMQSGRGMAHAVIHARRGTDAATRERFRARLKG